MKHIVMFSGGAGSYITAKRVIEQHGKEDVVLLFADTKIEDEDLYRFLIDAEQALGVTITRIAEGRTPWEVFRDVRFLGNSRVDPCSAILKRDFIDAWIKARYAPDECRVYVGIDWTEIHRYERLAPRKLPFIYLAPLATESSLMIDKEAMLAEMKADGIKVPRLYGMGFAHNNCGGFCIKAGHGHFKRLLEELPERYAEHEAKEEELRQYLGKPVAILRDRSGGKVMPLPLAEFRKRVQKAPEQIDSFDIGGCGCAI